MIIDSSIPEPSFFTMLSLPALLAVYRKFIALGGQAGYVAPEYEHC